MYRFDQRDNAIIMDGFENGIADNPYEGISDMRCVNVITVPGEASVNFATSKISYGTWTNIPVTGSSVSGLVTYSGAMAAENGVAVTFSASNIGGVSTSTAYWMGNGATATQCSLYNDPGLGSLVAITTNGTGTFSTINMSRPKYFTVDGKNNSYWLIDDTGRVWTNAFPSLTPSGKWIYAGNRVTGSSNGNGIGFYQSNTGTGYIFAFSNSHIDYTPSAYGSVSWTYQWIPTSGGNSGYSSSPTKRLNTPTASNFSHETVVGQDNTLYYCDSNYVGSFFEKPGQTFDPANIATYTYALQALTIPTIDRANCLTELGTNLLVGGQNNKIYPWNRTATSYTYPIWLAESNIQKMITVNTNTYVFCGNRGRIYITNGAQAELYKKIPDHISTSIEPYFAWGGVASTKNNLYFGVLATTNSGSALTTYGGVWAIDMATRALRLVNKLSYGSYGGFASALIAREPNVGSSSNPAGTGLFIGWDNLSYSGIDTTLSTPYTGSEATIDFDLIPIGTFERPSNFTRIEYKLSKPMVSGESVTLKYRTDFSQSYSTALTDSTAGNFSNDGSIDFGNVQWIQVQAVLNSTGTTPSYTRLKEVRLKGKNA